MAIAQAGFSPGGMPFSSAQLESIFDRCFLGTYRTRLIGGASEPLYKPGTECHHLYYREDYFASALHEVAHWCIAGETRRQQVDFGYWYAPDGRDEEAQRAFEQAELVPQALEWHFSRACGYPFRLSLDNLNGSTDSASQDGFKRAVLAQAQQWASGELPPRAQIFIAALRQEFGITDVAPFRLDELN